MKALTYSSCSRGRSSKAQESKLALGWGTPVRMYHHHHQPQHQRGFALVEALVALLLFSIGVLGLLGLQTRAISVVADAENRTRAAILADQCANHIQLLAGTTVTITGGARALAATCSSWNIDSSTNSQGLPNGTISSEADPLTTFTTSSGATTLVPVLIDITVKWTPLSDRAAQTQSQFVTKTTVMVRNS